jgi:hypothetical protein
MGWPTRAPVPALTTFGGAPAGVATSRDRRMRSMNGERHTLPVHTIRMRPGEFTPEA